MWLAQSPLLEPGRRALRTLPVVPGELFGPAAQQSLEWGIQANQTRRQFASLRGPTPLLRQQPPLGYSTSCPRLSARPDYPKTLQSFDHRHRASEQQHPRSIPAAGKAALQTFGGSRPRVQFRRWPPIFSGIRLTTVSDPKKSQALRQKLSILLEMCAIKGVDLQTQKNGFYSVYFFYPK